MDTWQNGLDEALERLREQVRPNPPRLDARDRSALAFVLDHVTPPAASREPPPFKRTAGPNKVHCTYCLAQFAADAEQWKQAQLRLNPCHHVLP